MSTRDSVELNISEDAVKYAKIISLHIEEEDKKKRAFTSIAALDTFADYLVSQEINVSISKNLFKIAPINAEFELADIYYNGWKLDVRAVGDDNVLTVPQVHFKSGITPDFYVAVKVDEELKKVEILGYVDSADINKKSKKGDYYIVESSAFLSNSELINKLKIKNDISLELKEHGDFEDFYLAYLDEEISAKDKKRLIKHLVNCKQCRETFVEFFDFETIVSNSKKYPDIFEDKTLGVVGAVEVDADKYDGQEVVINLNQNDDEILDSLFANSVPKNTATVETEEDEETMNFSSEDKEESDEEESDIEELAEELLEQDLGDEEDSSEEEIDFVIDDAVDDDLGDEGLKDLTEVSTLVEDDVSDDLEEAAVLDEPIQLEENLDATSDDDSLTFDDKDDDLDSLDFSDDDELEEIEDFSLDTADSEEFKLEESEEVSDAIDPENIVEPEIEAVKDELVLEEDINDELSEFEDVGLDLISEEPVETEKQLEEEAIEGDIDFLDGAIDSESLEANVDFLSEELPETSDDVEEIVTEDSGFLEDIDSLSTEDDMGNSANVETDVEQDIETSSSDLEEFTIEDLEVLTPQSDEEIVENSSVISDVENEGDDYSFLETDDYSEVEKENESAEVNDLQMEEISEQDLDDILTNEPDNNSFYEDAFGESDQDGSSVGFEDFVSEPGTGDEALDFNDSFEEVQETESSSTDDESKSTLNSLNLDELVLEDDNTEELDIPAAFKNIENPGASDKKKKLTVLMSAVVGCLLLATILGASLLISGNSKKSKEVKNNVVSQLGDKADLFNLSGDSSEEEKKVLKQPLANTPKDMNKVMTNVFSETPSSVTVTKIAWEVPQSFAVNDMFKEFLQISGRNLQVNLKSDLIDATEFAYNDRIKVNIAVNPEGNINDIKVLSSSGSTQIDDIVIKSIKETMDYINIPTIEQSKANVKNKLYNLKLVINF